MIMNISEDTQKSYNHEAQPSRGTKGKSDGMFSKLCLARERSHL